MWLILYNTILGVASPLIVLMLLAKKRCRRGLPERLGLDGWAARPVSPKGRRADHTSAQSTKPAVWIHAVSLGEVTAVTPLVKRLRGRYPDVELIVSTVTETGRQAVAQYLTGVATHRYAPLDFPWVVKRVVKQVNPLVYGFVETELWPNLLGILEKTSVPTVLLNGRISSRSYKRYRLIRPLVARMLRSTRCLMQSERDVERILALGAREPLVRWAGNLKFDDLTTRFQHDDPALRRKELGLGAREVLIVAGSTHPGEEECLLQCYQDLVGDFPFLVLLVAPRHLERVTQLEGIIQARGLSAFRRTAIPPSDPGNGGGGNPRVIILDTQGELASVYRDAEIAFVGGTLQPIGGHNLLEPAFWGKPVLFGPHTDHCADVAELLVSKGGGKQLSGAADLGPTITALLTDDAARHAMGQAANRVVVENQGATCRHLAELESLIDRRLRLLGIDRGCVDHEPQVAKIP